MPGPEADQPIGDNSRQATIRALRKAMQPWQRARQADDRSRISSGCEALDRLLPAGGFTRGMLIEWLGVGPGSGAGTLALLTAREALGGGGPLVVIDRRRTFYPPAVVAWGIDPARLILVHPTNDRDEWWSLDQVLRSSQVAAVLSWPERLDPRTFRRLQLAAETSGGLGLLIRCETARTEPSWADVRWFVRPQASAAGWRLHVTLLHLRGGFSRGEVELEVNPQCGTVHPVPPPQRDQALLRRQRRGPTERRDRA